MTVRVHRYTDADQLNAGVARHLVARLASPHSTSICLSDGLGDVLTALKGAVAKTTIDTKRLELWWSDERYVEVTDPSRVSTRTLAAIGKALRLSSGNVHPMPTPSGNADVDAAALQYADELGTTAFDLALLSLGDDGSVAGLATGSPAFTAPKSHTVLGVPDGDGERLTLTLRALARAEEVWYVATGDAIAKSLAKVVHDDESLPAGVLRGRLATHIFADQPASAELPWYRCEL